MPQIVGQQTLRDATSGFNAVRRGLQRLRDSPDFRVIEPDLRRDNRVVANVTAQNFTGGAASATDRVRVTSGKFADAGRAVFQAGSGSEIKNPVGRKSRPGGRGPAPL